MSIEFKPTYLYIKRHTKTGKLYFGKTCRIDPEKYTGSGKHWLNHINYHGNEHVETVWYCLFHNRDECNKFALMFSEQQNIVESKEWLNQIVETGLTKGGTKGLKQTEEHKKKIGDANRNKLMSEEQKLQISESLKGNIPWNKGKPGKSWTAERRAKVAEYHANKPKNLKPKKVRMNKKELSEFRKQFAGEKHSQFGKPKSEETKQKISDALKARKMNQKESHA